MRAFLAAALILIASAAQAQLLPIEQNLTQRTLPYGVSIPVIGQTDTVYPGCPAPPTSFGNTWYFSPSGQTEATMTTAGISLNPLVTPHQGDSTHPWNNLNALTATQSGYTAPLLATASGGSGRPINAGDEVLLMSGSYGAITFGGLFNASLEVVNSPALTIAAAPSQTPILTELKMGETTGFVVNGLMIQSLNTDGNPLAWVSDGGVTGFTASNIVFENMDISSASVATADGWTQAQWQSNARRGIVMQGIGGGGVNCISAVNNHVYVVANHNDGMIDALGSNALVQNNEVDHFSTTAIAYSGSNIAIKYNYIHDAVMVNPASGDQYIGIQDQDTGAGTNFTVAYNKMIESIDASQTFQAALNGFANFNGDMTNLTLYDNLIAGSGCQAIDVGNSHFGIVANNSAIDGGTTSFQNGCIPEIVVGSAHGGSTGNSVGENGSSYMRVFSNIAASYGFFGQSVQFDHNISTGLTFTTGGVSQAANAYGYVSVWSQCFLNPVSANVVATSAAIVHTGPSSCSTDAGLDNWLDGVSGSGAGAGADIFAAVPTPGSFPMSPQPDWTPRSGSPALTLGGAILIPDLGDFNGTPFAPPYTIGAYSLVASGPITISGQTGTVVTGLHITNPSGPCITISNSTSITIKGNDIGPCGANATAVDSEGILLHGTASNGVNIYDNYIHVETTESSAGGDWHDGVLVVTGNNITAQGNVFAFNETGFASEGNFAVSGVNVSGNFFLNQQGPFPRGQAIQIAGSGSVFNSNITVSNNYTVQDSTYPFAVATQADSVNLAFDNTPITVSDNYITATNSTGGAGIEFDSHVGGGSIINNILANRYNEGIDITSGANVLMDGNKIQVTAGTVNGMGFSTATFGGSTGGCGPITVSNNIVTATGGNGAYYHDTGCTGVTIAGSNTIDPTNPTCTPGYGLSPPNTCLAWAALNPIATTNPPPKIPPAPHACVAPSPYVTNTTAPPC